MSAGFDPYRDDVTALSGVTSITASAGTGKTWMVTHLATRWLLEGDHDPSTLLLVTFSRAAADELKSRLRERLVEIRHAIDDREPDPADWRVALRAWVDSVGIDEARRRVRRALGGVDEVHARTIHSFAAAVHGLDGRALDTARTLRERAVHEELITRSTHGDVALATVLAPGLKSDLKIPTFARRVRAALTTAENAGGADSEQVHFVGSGDEDESPTGLSAREDATVAIIKGAQSRARRLAERARRASYDDVITELFHEVSRPDSAWRRRLAERFGFVVIDEFQDTDALQWTIFDLVFARSERRVPVVIVGDAKQSIYGFRGSDVTVIGRVDDEADRRLTLATSYRSTGGLVDALNELFARGQDAGWTLGASDASRLTPATAAAHLAHQPGLFELRGLDEELDEAAIDDDVAAVARDLVTTHDVAPSEIAVVCRRRATVERVARALERAGLPAVTIGGSSVFASPAAAHLRVLLWSLRDVDDAGRRRALAATVFAPLGEGGPVALAHAMARGGVPALVRTALDRRVLAGLRSRPDGERWWTDLTHLCELLGAVDVRTPAELWDALDRLADTDDDESFPRRIESDRAAIRVMTAHRSKGLEFPIVLAPELDQSGRAGGHDDVRSWTGTEGRLIDVSSFFGHAAHDDESRRADAAEARRLIYVALTRAKSVVVGWVPAREGEWRALAAHARGATVATLRVVESGTPLALPESLEVRRSRTTALASPDLSSANPRPRVRLRRWSYSALDVVDHRASVTDEPGFDSGAAAEDEPDETIAVDLGRDLFDDLGGVSLGNALHRALELHVGAPTGIDALALAWREHGLGEVGPRAAASWSALVRRPLAGLLDGRSLNDLAAPNVAREMRFTLPLDSVEPGDDRLARVCALAHDRDPAGPFAGFFARAARELTSTSQLLEGMLTGSIDLVARRDDGRFVVVDYKSNLLRQRSSFAPGDLAVEMSASGYPLQGLLYLIALHRFLAGRVRDYDPTRHLAGMSYLYLRGLALSADPTVGVCEWATPPDVVVGASELFGATR